MANLIDRIVHGWNAFRNRDPTYFKSVTVPASNGSYGFGMAPGGMDKTILSAIYNRIATDVANTKIRHIQVDENGRYVKTIKSNLHQILTYSPNIDQTGRMLLLDATLIMLRDGYVALVPVETSVSTDTHDKFDIKTLRAARITNWYADRIEVEVYDQDSGIVRRLMPKKSVCAIIENPFYSTMNGEFSTLKRIEYKLRVLDAVDKQVGSGKWNAIIQVPYGVTNPSEQARMNRRKANIEKQMVDNKYGIVWIDGTEKFTQLNQPIENDLMKQVEYLVNLLYAQLGMSEAIVNGTASEAEMNNYHTRIITIILNTICDAMIKAWLTKTAITQGHTITHFKDPFKMAPLSALGDAFDQLIRNQILTPNECRAILGYMADSNPQSDQLYNPNMEKPSERATDTQTGGMTVQERRSKAQLNKEVTT